MKEESPILVVGGGISGITSAVELAEAGREVILVEKEAYLGGNVVLMNSYFPKFCPPNCGLEINYRRIRSNPRITVMTHSRVLDMEGEPGNFKVRIKQSPKYVNDFCTSCGKCAEVCPVEIENDFNYGFSTTKAAYLPHEMAFPTSYTIDTETCKGSACGKCLEACAYKAINLEAKEEVVDIIADRIIVTTGWKHYDAGQIENLGYAYPNVVTNVEFERLLAVNGPDGGKLQRLSDKAEPKKIAFVQCAGSRDENHLPYCSAVCCSASLKHALTLAERYPKAEVSIFFIDLRLTGRNEDLLVRARASEQIRFIKGKVGMVSESETGHNLLVEAEDILSGKKLKEEFDMVVLATGIVPNDRHKTIRKDTFGFALADQQNGIVVAATARQPMDVSASVKDATAAAIKSRRKIN